MIARRSLLLLMLAACTGAPRRLEYDGPEVTEIRISKSDRRMALYSGAQRLRSFDIALGQNPLGHKLQRGDLRTPEGVYTIDRRNPNSAFHLSLGIDYPNAQDRARAQAEGRDPGGDIFIHGHGTRRRQGDWTDGCVAVTNRQIEQIYAMVRDGTRVVITA
ncbi:L,D-transpeptidase family protein [Pararhodobacter zhoushanensis]|uniref:L,D-transpeptidase family protein n=1 Tax=Pararhodobacter zhoushanensis TaxID=2479545 RepID=A0ABT3GUK2_9RHOB|nr:L,D-transpeptidase family protein [Pararhodobacter zhoushanensis]MCW1931212.1 L,D-transpeptidase family protein [Pararhodobacter zhoushanensis]